VADAACVEEVQLARGQNGSGFLAGKMSVIAAGFFLALTIPLGWVVGRKATAGLGLMLAVVLLCIIAFSAEIVPVLILLGAYDFLGFSNPETFGRIPGLFKLRDLLLIIALLVACSSAFLGRSRNNPFRVYTVRATLAFTAYVLAVVGYTVLTGHSTLNLALRVAAPYFYYLTMVPVMAFASSPARLRRLLVGLLVLALVPEVVSALQIITQKQLTPFAYVQWIRVGAISLPRSYVLSFNLTGAAFLCLVGVYLFADSSRMRFLSMLCALIMFGGVVLTFGRAFWIATIGGTLFLLLVGYKWSRDRRALLKRANALWIRIGVVSVLIISFLAIAGKEGSFFEISGVISKRFTSVLSEVREREGSVAIRVEEAAFRMELFRRNPVQGVGYVHESSKYAAGLALREVGSADSGVITVLAQMGILGMIAVCALTAVFVKRGFFVFRKLEDPILKGVSLGILSFYFHVIMTFAGLTGVAFTHYAGICTLGLLVGLQEVMLYVEQEFS